jgi:hypothetical protein
MSFDTDTLFRLLPPVHLSRDYEVAAGLEGLLTTAEAAELATLTANAARNPEQQERYELLSERAKRGPLRALLAIFANEIGAMEENLEQLYDDLFVETCADWVLPYIGDLIGYRSLHGGYGDRRAELARTIAFRRRKGTLAMLEQLARDVTGCDARAVEFFQLLATTQNMNHVRQRHAVTPDLRKGLALERIGTAFDPIPHLLDVRRIASGRGRYNIPNIGIFLWRLPAQRRGPSSPAPHPGDATGRRYRFSALGNDVSLHTNPAEEGDIEHLAGPLNVPAPITRRVFREARDLYYGASLAVRFDSQLFLAANVRCCHLGDDGAGGWAHEAASGTVAIDPVLGRLALAPDLPAFSKLEVTWHEAAPQGIGGGAYARTASFAAIGNSVTVKVPADAPTVQAGIDAIFTAQESGVVEITDSGTYAESLQVDVRPGCTLEIRAAEGERPLLDLQGPMVLAGGAGSRLFLNGFLVSGFELHVPDQAHELERLEIRHSTLVPGRTLDAAGTPSAPGAPSVVVGLAATTLYVERSFLGAVELEPTTAAEFVDCVIDSGDASYVAIQEPGGGGPAGDVTFEGCTVIGEVRCRTLHASNSIFLSPTRAERLQEGCVRFSYLPEGSVAPRRHRCMPDPVVGPHVAPSFDTLRFGATGYARLTAATPAQIRRGAEDESEMGVFYYLHEPQRESDLRTRLEEYLRVGLEAGIFHES